MQVDTLQLVFHVAVNREQPSDRNQTSLVASCHDLLEALQEFVVLEALQGPVVLEVVD